MDSAVLFLLLLAFLFLLSRIVSQNLGLLVYILSGSKKIAVWFLALVFLPGTLVHEFAHAAVAEALRVYVGDIKLLPEIEGNSVKLGSVQVGKCDPLRNFLIGIAPLLVGLFLILLTVAVFGRFGFAGFWPEVGLFYLLFEVGNTMFSSKRDMEGAFELLAAVLLVFGFLYFVGVVRFDFALHLIAKMRPFFQTTNPILLKIVASDLVVVLAAGALRLLVVRR